MSPKGDDDDDDGHDHVNHVDGNFDDAHDDDEEAELDHYHDDDDEIFVCHSTRITIFRMLMLLMRLMMMMMLMIMRTKEEAKELVNICVGRPGRRQIRMTNGETLETRAIFKEQHTYKLHK